MLFCTSLVAYVGAGQQPALTPRKLSLLNTATSTTVQDMSFPSVVLAVLINKSRCAPRLGCLSTPGSRAAGTCPRGAAHIGKRVRPLPCMCTHRLVAVLEQQACVYALQTLAHLCSVDTPANHRGLAALTACEQPCLLALPAGSASSGTLRCAQLPFPGRETHRPPGAAAAAAKL